MQKGHDNLSNENLHEGCSNIEKDNADLSERFRQAKEKVKKTGDHMQHFDFVDIPHVPDQKFGDQLRATERQVKEANDQANKAKEKVRKLEECVELTRTKIGEGVNERDKAIQEFKQMVTRQKQEMRDAPEKVDKLE